MVIPYGRQSISEKDIEAVVEVLQSDYLTQGPVVPSFERALSEYVGAGYGVATNSATSALHIACMSLELGSDDVIWTSPITFVASANCGLYCGAGVDFVDIDPVSFNICPVALKEKLEQAAKANSLPKILIVVHMAGQSAKMEEIGKLAQQYGVAVIEDASHAIGGKYRGEPVGSCKWSDITVFSFHPVKIITTAEGGMAVTNSRDIAMKLELLRSHGVTRQPSLMHSSSPEPWYYEQIALGYNYRMTDLQAALGMSQLCRVDEFVELRTKAAAIYERDLMDLPLTLPGTDGHVQSSWHLYIIQIDPGRTDVSRGDAFRLLRDKGIGVNVHYIPVYKQPFYRANGFKDYELPVSENFYKYCISIPLFPGIIGKGQSTVISALREVLTECG